MQVSDWITHDGQGCPVDPESCPAIMKRRNAHGMRTNFKTANGTIKASVWENYGNRDCWKWLPDSTDGEDIIAYQEDEFVNVPLYPESVAV